MDVAAWLRGLALEQYAPAFHDIDVDSEVLSELTADDLISVGVTSVGHRRKLLAAIAALKSETASTLAADASDELSPTPASVFAARPTDAERRQLTVMFCDLVGSTEISARLDPEVLSDVIGAFQKGCVSAVTGFGGSVAKYMGDAAVGHRVEAHWIAPLRRAIGPFAQDQEPVGARGAAIGDRILLPMRWWCCGGDKRQWLA
jgi:hypothetical protein